MFEKVSKVKDANITIRVSKDNKKFLQKYVKSRNFKNVSEYIFYLIDKDLENHK